LKPGGNDFHLFVTHRWKRALYPTLKADDLERLPTRREQQASPRVGGKTNEP